MPGMDGRALAREIRERHGATGPRVILVAERYPSEKAREDDADGVVASLAKPVRRAALFQALTRARQAADSTPSARPTSLRAASPPASPPRRDRADVRGPTEILIAEDNPVNRKVAQMFFQKLGRAIDMVQTGREAIEAWRSGSYKIIFMDCRMPELDGFEATRKIRLIEARESLPRTAIVAMTANVMEGDRQECLQAGMDDYLSKPVRIEDLAAKLDAWLGPETARDRRDRVSPDNAGPAAP